jgi:hypothetical protein
MRASNVLTVGLALILLSVLCGIGPEERPVWALAQRAKKAEPPKPVQLPKEKLAEVRKKSAAYFATLDVDPIKVRKEKQMKGKKHFVEILHGYLYLYHLADTKQEKAEYKNKVQQLFKATEKPEYHNLSTIPIQEFREDSTSYLNACLIMTLFGLDNRAYKEEVKKALPRILADAKDRGTNQQMAFRYLLYRLGLAPSRSLDDLVARTVIRTHTDAATLMLPQSVQALYDITHEIFQLAEFGKKKINNLDASDWEYLRKVVPLLINHLIKTGDIDLLAEFTVDMKYLGFESMPEYPKALTYILNNQNPNGSFGHYEDKRAVMRRIKGPNYDLEIGGYLHTVEVCLWALAEAMGLKTGE